MNIEKHIEHTALKPETTLADIEEFCAEAKAYEFTMVCVPPLFVKKAKELTASSAVKVATVAGFPLGYNAIEAKVAEIVLAVIDGADEVEMVINTSAVKNKDWQYLANEINTVLPIIRGKGKKITVILETALMTDEEIITACDIYGAAAVDYIMAGTGYSADENAVEHIKLIRKHLTEAIQIKSAARSVNFNFARQLIQAGVNKISCNNGIQLIQEALQQN